MRLLLILLCMCGLAANATAAEPARAAGLEERFQQLDRNGDGRIARDELAEPQRPGEPPLKKMPDGDPGRDAAGRGQLFESICIPGVTDFQQGSNGIALADINLRDLDNDGGLDLLQSCHVDCASPELPYCPGEYRQGVFCWRNMLAETGQFRFENVTDNGLACVGRLKYNKTRQIYEPLSVGPGPPYVSLADVDNDGLRVVFSNDSYKSGCPLEAHFGLGKSDRVSVRVDLLDGKTVDFPAMEADRFLDCNLRTGAAKTVGG